MSELGIPASVLVFGLEFGNVTSRPNVPISRGYVSARSCRLSRTINLGVNALGDPIKKQNPHS